jgi:hypothetical protein
VCVCACSGRIQLASHETLMGRFKHDLHAVIQDLLHGDKLAEGMQQLKESYALEDTTAQKPNEVCVSTLHPRDVIVVSFVFC